MNTIIMVWLRLGQVFFVVITLPMALVAAGRRVLAFVRQWGRLRAANQALPSPVCTLADAIAGDPYAALKERLATAAGQEARGE